MCSDEGPNRALCYTGAPSNRKTFDSTTKRIKKKCALY